jgi:hypothetical protein
LGPPKRLLYWDDKGLHFGANHLLKPWDFCIFRFVDETSTKERIVFYAMKKVASFEITENFNVTTIGLVILGNILSGEVNHGNFISFKLGSEQFKLKISEINFARKRNVPSDWVGLSFAYDNYAEKEFYKSVKLISQVALITSE